MTTDVALYVYAIVEHARKPRVPRRAGVPGAGPPRAITVGTRRWAIAAEVPAAVFAADAVRARLSDMDWVGECALGHERVVEAVLGANAVAPMRLFAVFRDEAALVAKLRRAKRRLDRTLAGVRGRLECGVRVWPAPETSTATTAAPSGTAFLEARAERIRRDAAPTPEQTRAAAALFKELALLASRTRTRSSRALPKAPAISRQFLVARRNLRAFRTVVSRGRRRLRSLGLEVAVLGPHPAYSFV